MRWMLVALLAVGLGACDEGMVNLPAEERVDSLLVVDTLAQGTSWIMLNGDTLQLPAGLLSYAGFQLAPVDTVDRFILGPVDTIPGEPIEIVQREWCYIANEPNPDKPDQPDVFKVCYAVDPWPELEIRRVP